MYYPYFRGKQYELITVRECASYFSEKKIIPIIEPVKEQLSGLEKALTMVCDAGANAIVIINPQHGDHKKNGSEIISMLNDAFEGKDNIFLGVLLTEDMSAKQAYDFILSLDSSKEIALIHAGFSQAKDLTLLIGHIDNIKTNVFIEDYCGKLYRRHFNKHSNRVLIRDGFEKRKNREHPKVEFFSDLHITYEEEGMDGFGDFLMVGDDYSETGGPAYTIAIHLTFIDCDKDEEMHIHHFKSDRQDTPTDPAGKFEEALSKLISELSSSNNKFDITSSIQEFKDLSGRGHFPGLGYVKKLSMKHHIETIGNYIENF